MKASTLRAISARLFLGTFRKRVNSTMSPFIYGHRQAISILDLTNSVFRLQKFLLFVRCAVKYRSSSFYILNPSYMFLIPSIIKLKQGFVSKWIGGVLTNYSCCCFYYSHSHEASHLRKFPGAVVTNQIESLNETRLTRTPAAFLASSDSNVYHTIYGVTGNCDFQAFKALTELSLMSCKQGLRLQKINFGRTLYNKLKQELLYFKPQTKLQNPNKYLFSFIFGLLALHQHLLPFFSQKITSQLNWKKKLIAFVRPIIFKTQEITVLTKKKLGKSMLMTELNWHFHKKTRLSLTRLPIPPHKAVKDSYKFRKFMKYQVRRSAKGRPRFRTYKEFKFSIQPNSVIKISENNKKKNFSKNFFKRRNIKKKIKKKFFIKEKSLKLQKLTFPFTAIKRQRCHIAIHN